MPDTVTNAAARESETSLVLRKNPSHNVVAHLELAKNSLAGMGTLSAIARLLQHF
jgi:hypothetical protein